MRKTPQKTSLTELKCMCYTAINKGFSLTDDKEIEWLLGISLRGK